MSEPSPGAAWAAAEASPRRQPDFPEVVPEHRGPDAADVAPDRVERRTAVQERVGRFLVEKAPQLSIELVAARVVEDGAGLLDQGVRRRVLEGDEVRAVLRLRGM